MTAFLSAADISGTDRDTSSSLPVRILANRYDGHLGSARNSAAEVAADHILAFIDDDAGADFDWLGPAIAPYEAPFVIPVGGAPIPKYEVPRPRWFPIHFDWVFGWARIRAS